MVFCCSFALQSRVFLQVVRNAIARNDLSQAVHLIKAAEVHGHPLHPQMFSGALVLATGRWAWELWLRRNFIMKQPGAGEWEVLRSGSLGTS